MSDDILVRLDDGRAVITIVESDCFSVFGDGLQDNAYYDAWQRYSQQFAARRSGVIDLGMLGGSNER